MFDFSPSVLVWPHPCIFDVSFILQLLLFLQPFLVDNLGSLLNLGYLSFLVVDNFFRNHHLDCIVMVNFGLLRCRALYLIIVACDYVGHI